MTVFDIEKEEIMKKILSILFILLFLILGCGNSNEIDRYSIGKIIDANVIPASFNEGIKIQIKTAKSFVVLFGIISVPLGVEAYIVKYDSGRSYITWNKADKMYPIVNSWQ